MNEQSEKKLKRERIETCLNCQNFLTWERIGKVEPCSCEDFVEIEGEAWVIKKL